MTRRYRPHSHMRPTTPFGDIIRQARLKQKKTQPDVAAAVGLSRTTAGSVARWESGEQLPLRKYLPNLAQILALPADELEQVYNKQVVNSHDKFPSAAALRDANHRVSIEDLQWLIEIAGIWDQPMTIGTIIELLRLHHPPPLP